MSFLRCEHRFVIYDFELCEVVCRKCGTVLNEFEKFEKPKLSRQYEHAIFRDYITRPIIKRRLK